MELSFREISHLSIGFREISHLSNKKAKMARSYTMRKRGEALERIRERIMQATMQLHDEKGPASTTFADIAERAGVGQATVYRHFPTIGELVRNCGAHVWQEMQPPVPEAAAAVFSGLSTRHERLGRLVEELDAFYARGAHRLKMAGNDREKLPELDGFLSAVEAGVEALVREALKSAEASEPTVRIVAGLASFPVWAELDKTGLPREQLLHFRLRLLECAIKVSAGIA
jgi:AcrR family transcriptional regulator